jgi:hypothetical protein
MSSQNREKLRAAWRRRDARRRVRAKTDPAFREKWLEKRRRQRANQHEQRKAHAKAYWARPENRDRYAAKLAMLSARPRDADHCRAHRKRHRARHRERLNAYKREYRSAHPEQAAAYRSTHREERREQDWEYRIRRRFGAISDEMREMLRAVRDFRRYTREMRRRADAA